MMSEAEWAVLNVSLSVSFLADLFRSRGFKVILKAGQLEVTRILIAEF